MPKPPYPVTTPPPTSPLVLTADLREIVLHPRRWADLLGRHRTQPALDTLQAQLYGIDHPVARVRRAVVLARLDRHDAAQRILDRERHTCPLGLAQYALDQTDSHDPQDWVSVITLSEYPALPAEELIDFEAQMRLDAARGLALFRTGRAADAVVAFTRAQHLARILHMDRFAEMCHQDIERANAVTHSASAALGREHELLTRAQQSGNAHIAQEATLRYVIAAIGANHPHEAYKQLPNLAPERREAYRQFLNLLLGRPYTFPEGEMRDPGLSHMCAVHYIRLALQETALLRPKQAAEYARKVLAQSPVGPEAAPLLHANRLVRIRALGLLGDTSSALSQARATLDGNETMLPMMKACYYAALTQLRVEHRMPDCSDFPTARALQAMQQLLSGMDARDRDGACRIIARYFPQAVLVSHLSAHHLPALSAHLDQIVLVGAHVTAFGGGPLKGVPEDVGLSVDDVLFRRGHDAITRQRVTRYRRAVERVGLPPVAFAFRAHEFLARTLVPVPLRLQAEHHLIV